MEEKAKQNRLIQYRRRMGYTREQVATLLGHCDASMVRRYERGASVPPMTVALMLEIIYRVPVAFLYSALYEALRERIRNEEDSLGPTQQPLF